MRKSLAIIIALSAMSFAQPAVAEPLGSGLFSGASCHATSGRVTVTKQNGQYVIDLGAELGSNKGAQRYVIDATAALDGATQVIIWCKKYAVPLGVAAIQ